MSNQPHSCCCRACTCCKKHNPAGTVPSPESAMQQLYKHRCLSLGKIWVPSSGERIQLIHCTCRVASCAGGPHWQHCSHAAHRARHDHLLCCTPTNRSECQCHQWFNIHQLPAAAAAHTHAHRFFFGCFGLVLDLQADKTCVLHRVTTP